MDISLYWRTIFDTLHDGLLVVDPKGQIVEANQAAEEVTGYSRKELVGSSCRILNCTGCKILDGGCGHYYCGLFQNSRVHAKKCMITNKNGRSVHILKNGSVLRDTDGQVIGAVETLTDMSEVVRQQQEILSLRQAFRLDDRYHGMSGKSTVMQSLFSLIENVAHTEAPVLIQGESGTGKELVARAVHEAGLRRGQPFIKVNCAALNENLLESELFGHVRGAFTGADRDRVGRFEAAHSGTIFLDEIGDIPMSIQVKLLRVLEEKEIERVGDHKPIPVDVRIISATNKNLEKLIAEEIFREDLFFRINVFPLHCPPLRERREDIPAIVRNFIQTSSQKEGKKIDGLTPDAMELLLTYFWPGNVRELRNAIEYAFVLCPGGEIKSSHLPPRISRNSETPGEKERGRSADDPQRDAFLRVLRQAGGNQSETARLLGVSRVTVWKRIRKYGIDLKRDLV